MARADDDTLRRSSRERRHNAGRPVAPADALAGLREVPLQHVRWLVERRGFGARLLTDAAGEAGGQRFLATPTRRHPALLLRRVQSQQAGQLRRDDPRHPMLFLMSTLAAPVLMFHLLGARGLALPGPGEVLASFSTGPAAAQTRLDWTDVARPRTLTL